MGRLCVIITGRNAKNIPSEDKSKREKLIEAQAKVDIDGLQGEINKVADFLEVLKPLLNQNNKTATQSNLKT